MRTLTITLSERLGHFEIRKTFRLEFLVAAGGFFGSKGSIGSIRNGSESFDWSDFFRLGFGRSVF